MPDPDDDAQSAKDSAKASSNQAVSVESPAKNYVAATLQAWESCPGIVKKQLDKLNDEICELKGKLREADVKI